MTRLNQIGSHVIAATVGLVVLAVIAFAGYTVVNKDTNTTNSTATTSSKSGTKGINNDADLSAASKTLDNSFGSLNSGLNDNALDSDLDDLL